MAKVGIRSFWLLCGLLGAGERACAETRFDYSGLFAGQLAGVPSEFTLAPLSDTPFSLPEHPDVVGRFYGRLDLVPSMEAGPGRLGLHAGLYSNLNTLERSRGVVPFDTHRFNLTRIREETALDVDKLYLFHDTRFGRVELGINEGINERTKVTAPLNWGVGSVGGDYPYFLDKPLDVGFVSLSALGSANPGPRASYLTSRFFGVRAGVSYEPDTRYTGLDFDHDEEEFGILGRRLPVVEGNMTQLLGSGTFEAHTAGFQNVFEAALDSEYEIWGIRIASSLGGIVGSAVESPSGTDFNDLASVQAGLLLGYGNWSAGGGVVWAGDSGYSEQAHWRQRSNQHNIHGGVQYQSGRWTAGGAFLFGDDAGDPTERSDRQLWVYSAGLRYELTRDLDIGVELDRILPLSADFGDYEVYAAIAQLRYRLNGPQR